MTVKIGQKVIHKKFGEGKVIFLDYNRKFTVVFADGQQLSFFVADLPVYFQVQQDALLTKYAVDDELDPETKRLLEQFDKGDHKVGRELAERLDGLNEFHSVVMICGRLESSGHALDPFLLIKKAKALRRIKKSEAAVDAAAKAVELSYTPESKSIALTVRAAALVDIESFGPAVADCKKALILKPNSFQILRVLGRIDIKQEKYKEADKHFAEADKLDPHPNDYQIKEYLRRIAELRRNGFPNEIEQIREHIQLTWPSDKAKAALAEIDKCLGKSKRR